MALYSIFEHRETHWILHESDPQEISFPSSSPFANWSLFSPIVLLPAGFGGRPSVTPLGDGGCLISTPRIDFRTPIDNQDEAERAGARILRWLRYVSGQSDLGTKIVAHNSYPDHTERTFLSPRFSDPPQVAVVHHVQAGALTFPRIQARLQRDPSMTVPVYAEVLLDAIDAASAGDYRKAILYSAIAVESMAGTRIEEMFQKVCRGSPGDLRQVKVTLAGGSVIEKDPVYDELRKVSERNFKFLLHHLPLYVARRSLLVEKPALYAELLTLHTTRNDLVHGGDIEQNDRVPIDHHGAKRTLRAAIGAYAWFEATGRYVTMHGQELEAG